MSLFFFGDNVYKNKDTCKTFSPQILEVYRILLVETTVESIMFCYTFSVINTMFVPCISSGIHVISLLIITFFVFGLFSQTVFQVPPSENSQAGWDVRNGMARGYRFDAKWVCLMGSYAWGIHVICSRNEVTPQFSNRTLEYLRHKFPWDRLISRQTDNPWSSYPQDLNPRDYFLRGSTWKTEFMKTIHRQERISSGEKSDGFHKKCSMDLWTFLMSELLLCCLQQRGAWNEHSINYWKSIAKHYWFYSGFHQKNSINFQYLWRKNLAGVLFFVKVIIKEK